MGVELLAPAGSVEALNAAVYEGADAVYFGLKSFNARLRGANFAWNQAQATVEALHKRGKKAYITVNTVVQENECEKLYQFLVFLSKINPDALIVQDLGVVKMLRMYFPNLKIHASTQMNIASSKGANIVSRSGVSRVVLARELSLKEIAEIHFNTNCELEVFVHGALCISESGLCMFSSYLGGKSANRGMCTQACRRYYEADFQGRKRAGYFFSPYDLQLIDVIPDLIKAGVSSFKIEGRMKSAEYVAQVVKAYRYVIDHAEDENIEEVLAEGKKMLLHDFSREKTYYHIFSSSLEEVLQPDQAGGTGISLGKILEVVVDSTSDSPNSFIHFSSKHSLNVGDSIRIHERNDKKRESFKIIEVKNRKEKQFVKIAGVAKIGDFVYLIQERCSKHYPYLLPNNLDRYRLKPRGEKLPPLVLDSENYSREKSKQNSYKRQKKDFFPKGLYVQVSSFNNINVLISGALRPTKLIVNLNEETKKSIEDYELQKGINPFSKKDTIISLDPFLKEDALKETENTLGFLVESGYFSFVLNNLAHLKILKEIAENLKNIYLNLIAGPYLYTFNRYVIKYLEEMGITKIISPIENSYSNLEACYKNRGTRQNVLLSIFAYPALFRISSPLPHSYDFFYIRDKEKMTFKAFSTPSQSFVLPEKPFSITHRVGHLRKNGFEHFLLDFSHTAINVKEYKFILNAFNKEEYIQDTSYFNWKEGFYQEKKQ